MANINVSSLDRKQMLRQNQKKTLLYIINEPTYFVSHRLPIAIAAQKIGYEIHVATGVVGTLRPFIDAGFTYHYVPLSRSGRNVFKELKTIWALWRLMKKIQPDIIHLVTIKPVIYGSLAARLAKVPAVVAAVPGLGYAFIDRYIEAHILRKIISHLYHHAFKHPNIKIIFQNEDDLTMLFELGVLKKEQATIIRGSGVDLNHYSYVEEPTHSPCTVLMASRLLKDKGILEYVQAAQTLKKRNLDFRFLLAGQLDPENPSSIKQEQLTKWINEGAIEFLGYQQDMAGLIRQVNLVVLPSYREGLPRVLAEAAACGRAVVTTDVAGCRSAIVPDKTGLLSKPQDADSLANAIHRLILDNTLRKNMGLLARRHAEENFNIVDIVAAHLKIYHELSVVSNGGSVRL